MGVLQRSSTPCALFCFRAGAFQKVLQGDPFEEGVDHPVQLFPHGQGMAAGGPGAGGRTLGSAGYRSKAALGQLQNAAHSVLLGFSVQTVAAALAVDRIHKAAFGKSGHNGFQVLLRDALCFRDLL